MVKMLPWVRAITLQEKQGLIVLNKCDELYHVSQIGTFYKAMNPDGYTVYDIRLLKKM